jgi:hypothetical protein
MSRLSSKNLDYMAYTANSTGYICSVIEFVRVYPPEPIHPRDEQPNSRTAKAIAETMAGKDVVQCESANEMFRKLGI